MDSIETKHSFKNAKLLLSHGCSCGLVWSVVDSIPSHMHVQAPRHAMCEALLLHIQQQSKHPRDYVVTCFAWQICSWACRHTSTPAAAAQL